MRSTNTILGNSSGIKFASASGFEFSSTGVYTNEETVKPNLTVDATGMKILTDLYVVDAKKTPNAVMHSGFISRVWTPFLTAFDLHIHTDPVSGVTLPPTVPVTPVFGIPAPVTVSEVLSVGNL